MKFLLKFLKWLAVVLVSIVLLMYIFNVDYLLRAVKTIYFKGYRKHKFIFTLSLCDILG